MMNYTIGSSAIYPFLESTKDKIDEIIFIIEKIGFL